MSADSKTVSEQPTYDDLHEAWMHAINCEGIGGAHAAALQELQALRDRKSTWFGAKENSLRWALDNYLQRVAT